MTREIKFRAWNKNNDEMVYSFDYPYHWNIGDLGLELLESDGTDYVRQEALFMQFTGLYDKNNSPIYEGDVIAGPHDYGPGGFIEVKAPVGYHVNFGYQLHYFLLDETEVIGNIHEHNHLLGGVDE